MTSYRNDPRQITAKFTSSCQKCKCKITKGTEIYYWPATRSVYCLTCGDADYRQFILAAQDEDSYSRNSCYR